MTRLDTILKLSTLERISLIEKIWDSIDKEEIALSTKQKKELDKRLESIEQGETEFSSWIEVKQKLGKLKNEI